MASYLFPMDNQLNQVPMEIHESSFEAVLPLPIVEGSQRLHDFHWLNDCALQLLSITDPDDIYSFAAEALQNKLGECIIVSLAYLPDDRHLRWKAIHGVSHQLWEKALKIIGFDLRYIILDILPDFQDAYRENRLYEYKGGFVSLASFLFPSFVAQALNKLFHIQRVYNISLKNESSLLGVMHIFDCHPHRNLDATLIEIFTYQCALALERAVASAEMQHNLKRLTRSEAVANIGHWEYDLNTKTIFASEGARRICGLESRTYSLSEIQQIPLSQYRQMLDNALYRLTHRNVSYDVRFKIRRINDGQMIDIHSIAEYDSQQNIIFGIIQDTTEEGKRKEKLQASEERYRRISEITSDIIYAYQQTPKGEYRLAWVSGAVERICGYSISEMTERGGWTSLVLEEDLPTLTANVLQLSPGSSALCELRIRRKNGSIVWVLSLAQCITMKENGLVTNWIYGGLVNITYRKQSEEALRQAQKLAAVGTLAAGIAHEMNTPLQVITGITDSLIQSIKRDENVHSEHLVDSLEKVSRNAWRIAQIVRAIDIYAHPNIKKAEEQDLNELINQASLLAAMKLPDEEKLSISLKLHQKLPKVACDPKDITEMLIHLLSNTRDAMPDGGEIIISTFYNEKKEEVAIKVKDNGIGIAPELQKKVFDPFFTTKEVGKGAGLGLSIVQGIMRSYGGRVEIKSTQNKGTTVILFFPLKPSDDPPPELADEDEPPGRYHEDYS